MKSLSGKFKFFAAAFISLGTWNFLYAQPHLSTQAHEGKVNSICNFETKTKADESFYTAGNDGFIIKWSSDGMGEHYQITDLQVKSIVRNPATSDIAVYETDGIATHKVTVLDSRSFSKKYTKRFNDTVTALNFSEKGNFLIVGTAAVNGTYILSAKTGSIAKKTTDLTGIISYAKTGPTEKTAVFYSPSGTIIYYDLSSMKVMKKFNCESKLNQVQLAGSGKYESMFLAGEKDGTIYIIDATSGKNLALYSAKNTQILSSATDGEDEGIYFIINDGKSNILKLVTNETLRLQRQAASSQIMNPPAPLVVKKFTNLKNKDVITCASKNSGTIILGTQSGNIYTLTDIPESETYTLFPLTEKMYERIYDITSDNQDFYLLTSNAIYKSSYDTKVVDLMGRNPSQTNILKYENYAILWSKNTKKSVVKVDLSDKTKESTVLFTPDNILQNLRIFGNKIIYIQGTSTVSIYNLDTKENTKVFTGTSVQDAVLIDEKNLYVAKTSTSENDSPIATVDITTGETAPLNFNGNVAFSLCYDYDNSRSALYGIVIRMQNGSAVTEVFSYSPDSKTSSALLRLNEEDTSAFTALYYPVIYTNLGKNQVYACTTTTRKNQVMRRSASMPIKVERCDKRIAILNRNGSISWYNSTSQSPLSDWYLTVSGEWMEF